MSDKSDQTQYREFALEKHPDCTLRPCADPIGNHWHKGYTCFYDKDLIDFEFMAQLPYKDEGKYWVVLFKILGLKHSFLNDVQLRTYIGTNAMAIHNAKLDVRLEAYFESQKAKGE